MNGIFKAKKMTLGNESEFMCSTRNESTEQWKERSRMKWLIFKHLNEFNQVTEYC